MAGLGIFPRSRRGGFTLLELLLTLVLLMALLGATVFSFSSLQRRASLDEGVERIQTLFRFARAHAAASGRVVELTFHTEPSDLVPGETGASGDTGEGEAAAGPSADRLVEVRWEPDPAAQPGRFVALPLVLPGVEELIDLVRVDSLTVTQAGAVALPEGMEDPRDILMPASADQPMGPAGGMDSADSGFAPDRIRFFPDGASDSARITLASRDAEDLRLAVVELIGITGLSRVAWRTVGDRVAGTAVEDAFDDPEADLEPAGYPEGQP